MSTIICNFPVSTKEQDDDMGKVDEVAGQLGRLEERVNNYIKFFWAATVCLGIWLGTVSLALYNIKGEIKQLPGSLSTQLIKESVKLVRAGQAERAIRSIEMAATLMKTARENRTKPTGDYFKNTSQALQEIGLQSTSPKLRDSAHTAITELASYRSAVEPMPSLVGPEKGIFASIQAQSIQGPGVFHVQTHGDFLTGPIVRKLSNNEFIIGGIFVGELPDTSETLDGFHWINTTFVNFKIRYEGGEVELRNVRFVNCTFEFPNDPRGDVLAIAIANLKPQVLIPEKSS